MATKTDTAPQKPRAQGGTCTPTSRGGKFAEMRAPDAKAAARALFEATPGGTCGMVATKMGVPEPTVRRWKAESNAAGQPWKPAHRTVQNLSGKAGELANSFRTKMSELGKPMDDAVAAAEAEKELAEGFAVDVRAQLLDRHRKEWGAPRKIAYEAMAAGNLEKAKLAKIAAETLMLIQTGECRAYGMDAAARGADDKRTVVVIDRNGAEDAKPAEPDEPMALIERDDAPAGDEVHF